MELPTIEQLNLQANPSEIEEWVERFELWCSIRKGGSQNQSALFPTAGGYDLYSLLKNLAFPEAPAKLPYESLKSTMHLLPVDISPPSEMEAHERAKFNSMIRADHVSCRDFILKLNKQASRCNYGDRLEELLCDRLVAVINNLTLQQKLLEKKDLNFAEARKICGQHDLMRATSSKAVTLFQRQKTRTNRLPIVKCIPKPPQDSSGNEKRINPLLYVQYARPFTALNREMNVQPVKLVVDGEPIFLKRRLIPYGQCEGVLQALEKMERDGIITRVTSSAWATPIVIAIKVTAKHREFVAITG
ncbi:unnamed protein product [Echinostoma caproni]|uniref:Reverse transcriptase n=1 Tax=Echinostoma caproni TaxID=27848 RepID=A0A183APZ9_9TREM|nr:unnamed protein product [Echinostoma caproni]